MIKILLLLFIASPLFSWTLRVEPTLEGLQFRRLIDTFYPQEADFDPISYGEYDLDRLASFIYMDNKLLFLLNDNLQFFNLRINYMYYYWLEFERDENMVFHLRARRNKIINKSAAWLINAFIERHDEPKLATYSIYRK